MLVWYGEAGGDIQLAIDYTGLTHTTTTSFWLGGSGTGIYRYDDVELVADGWTRTAAFTYDAGNKLSTMTVGGVTTSYAYDAAGRTTSQTKNGVTTACAWSLGGHLTGVDLTDDGTADVTYEYGADGARRTRTEGATTVRYNWSAGALLSEEDDGGTLVKTYIGAQAEVIGSNPATGAYRYHFRDGHSARVLRDHAKVLVASTEFNTYGEIYHRTGSLMSEGYARHQWDTTVSLLFSSPVSPGTGQSLGTGGNAFRGPVTTPSPTGGRGDDQPPGRGKKAQGK